MGILGAASSSTVSCPRWVVEWQKNEKCVTKEERNESELVRVTTNFKISIQHREYEEIEITFNKAKRKEQVQDAKFKEQELQLAQTQRELVESQLANQDHDTLALSPSKKQAIEPLFTDTTLQPAEEDLKYEH